jgi:hypothetical protein
MWSYFSANRNSVYAFPWWKCYVQWNRSLLVLLNLLPSRTERTFAVSVRSCSEWFEAHNFVCFDELREANANDSIVLGTFITFINARMTSDEVCQQKCKSRHNQQLNSIEEKAVDIIIGTVFLDPLFYFSVPLNNPCVLHKVNYATFDYTKISTWPKQKQASNCA